MHSRIAACLGWTVEATRGFSLQALRELVRPLSPALAEEISEAISQGVIVESKAPVPYRSWKKTRTPSPRGPETGKPPKLSPTKILTLRQFALPPEQRNRSFSSAQQTRDALVKDGLITLKKTSHLSCWHTTPLGLQLLAALDAKKP